jgi:hypothetical protein
MTESLGSRTYLGHKLGEHGEDIIVEGTRGECEPLGLVDQSTNNLWVTVALVDSRVGT